MTYKKTYRQDKVPVYGITIIDNDYQLIWEYFTQKDRDEHWKRIIKEGI